VHFFCGGNNASATFTALLPLRFGKAMVTIWASCPTCGLLPLAFQSWHSSTADQSRCGCNDRHQPAIFNTGDIAQVNRAARNTFNDSSATSVDELKCGPASSRISRCHG